MGRIRLYTKLAFGYRLPKGEFKTFFVGEDTSGANVKPWAVFVQYDMKGTIHQISNWYFYRGCAERALRKIKAEYREDYQ